MKLLFGAVILMVVSLTSEGRVICHHDSYTMRGSFCYRYVVSSATYSQALIRCQRDNLGSSLLYIDSAEENRYIWSEMFAENDRKEFWLGLDDQLNEGDFRWAYNKSRPIYTNFSEDIEDTNNDNYDCVKFTEDGWQIAEAFCENIGLPFICKAPVCDSSDGVICDDVNMEKTEDGGLSAGAIAAIIIVIIVLICVVVVLISLALLWKFKNDVFHRYVCPCVGRGSKQALMSLQQENQRLRQELNQSKISSSNRFSQGHFGRESVSGVPDGMGGMLPALKPGGGGTGYVSPEPFSLTKPPPMSLQRGMSRVTPMTPSGGPVLSSPPLVPPVFTAQSQRAIRQPSVVKPGSREGFAVGGALLPPLKESNREDQSSSSSDSEDETHSPLGKAEEPQPPQKSEEVKGQEEVTDTAGNGAQGTEVKTDS